MMQNHYVPRGKWGKGIGSTVEIGKLDLEDAVSEVFHGGSDLPLRQTFCRYVVQKGYNVH